MIRDDVLNRIKKIPIVETLGLLSEMDAGV
jgi:hypothetical protein